MRSPRVERNYLWQTQQEENSKQLMHALRDYINAGQILSHTYS